jgi:uncharacterized SAM-binding protein YcdF (DUF218 family)
MKDETELVAVSPAAQIPRAPRTPPCRCCRIVAMLLLAGAATMVIAGWGLGRWLEAPGQPASSADVIVVLGGDTGSRLLSSVDLYRRGFAPAILLAGIEADDLSKYDASLNLRLQYLLGQGIPRSAIWVDGTSRNSWEEAANALKLMQGAGWHKALVISDPPHLRRLSWVWERAFTQSNASYVLVASRPSWWKSADWWRDEKSGAFVLMESIKIGYYYLAH